jgi:hypothetical protein
LVSHVPLYPRGIRFVENSRSHALEERFALFQKCAHPFSTVGGGL